MLIFIWNKWKVIAGKIGNFQTTVIFSILYFILILPVGAIANIFNDYLKVKSFPQWERWEKDIPSIKNLKEQ